MRKKLLFITYVFLITTPALFAQKQTAYTAIYSGIPWLDDQGHTVSAHGANIIKEKDRCYLFGEKHTDTSNAFAGFNCYSSKDLYNWKWEGIALPPQLTGKLGPARAGERPKVMKCPSTGEYLMYMHVDTMGYTDQFVGYAAAKKITGPYTFQGPLLFNGKPIRKWDMGVFQDSDGSGYILLHGGDIYKLSDDYKSIIEQVTKSFTSGFESPALFRKDSLYYFLGSHLTGWERNDNEYYTAASLKGPWTLRGTFAPLGSLTWNAQTTFVLPVQGSEDTTYLFMGDRWSFPKQASAATYVWQPLTIAGYTISIPEYREAWKIDPSTGQVATAVVEGKTIKATDNRITWRGNWQQDTLNVKSADEKGASFSIKFKGTQIGLYGLARSTGGYAAVSLHDGKGKVVLTSVVDMYSKYPVSTLKFLSPLLPKDNYILTVSVLREAWYWIDKRKNRSGSAGYVVSMDKLIIRD